MQTIKTTEYNEYFGSMYVSVCNWINSRFTVASRNALYLYEIPYANKMQAK